MVIKAATDGKEAFVRFAKLRTTGIPVASSRSQIDKFRDLARELECDEDEDAFKAKLRQIAATPPQHRDKPPSE